MTLLFSVILFVNNDLSLAVQSSLTTQLMLSEIIDGYEFDARVAADPNYPTEVHLNNLRVMVMRPLSDFTNRNLADIVIFIKGGLAYIECNKFGRPGQTYPIARLQLEQLIEANKHPSFCCPPQDPTQSNILYPLFPHQRQWKYPFGSDPIRHCEIPRGLLVSDADDYPACFTQNEVPDNDDGYSSILTEVDMTSTWIIIESVDANVQASQFTANTGNWYVGMKGLTNNRTVFIPAMVPGTTITIKDEDGSLANWSIIIATTDGTLIDGSTTYTMTGPQNGVRGSVTLLRNNLNPNSWSIT